MDAMGIRQEDMSDGIEFGGAATWLDAAAILGSILSFKRRSFPVRIS
jgi:hypothetical protein